MTMVKKTQSNKASKSSRKPKQGSKRRSEKSKDRPSAASRTWQPRTVSARVSPAQHREVRALASINGETIQTLLLRLLRDAGVKSITVADLLDQRCGEGRAQRKPKRTSAKSTERQVDVNSIGDQLDQLLPLLGLSGIQRSVPGGLTLVINNYLRPDPTS